MADFLIDVPVRNDLRFIAEDARTAEELGAHAAWNSETDADPFAGLTLMAEHTRRIGIGPSIAVAFARNPMSLAYQAYQLQAYSQGRLLLGLGSQIKPHIERRFAMPWSKPAARMRDYLQALRAIWSAWSTGGRLHYTGEFYSHTLMPPLFRPAPSPAGPPRIYLAAVNELMLRVAGEVADGVLPHPFSTERYLREVVRPNVEVGQLRAGRPSTSVEVAVSVFVATNEREQQAVRRQIAFYGSTPAYRPVLELHGWGDLQSDLHALSLRNRWDEMARQVPDEVIAAMSISGTPAEVANGIRERYAGLADRIGFATSVGQASPTRFAAIVDALRSA